MSIDGKYWVTMQEGVMGGELKRSGVMKLQRDGEYLNGSMFPPFFWLEAPFRGGKYTDDNHFSFTVHFNSPCQQFSMSVDGVVNGDEVEGEVHTPMGKRRLYGKRIVE